MENTKNIEVNPNLVAYCGLYCGSCRKYLNNKCPGCAKNDKASWCKVRSCCMENNYKSCADCKISKPEECKKLNNFVAKIFSLIFKSDRLACINCIKKEGYESFVQQMTTNKTMCFKRK